MSDDEMNVVENGPSVRVPEEGNPFAEQYAVIAGLRLPLASADSLYQPRISMKDMIVAAGWDFPCRVDDDIDGPFEVAVCEEGFLVRSWWHVLSRKKFFMPCNRKSWPASARIRWPTTWCVCRTWSMVGRAACA